MRSKGPYIGGAVIILSILILLPAVASYTVEGAILRSLPLGWLHFLERNLPKMSVNGSLILTGIVCSVLVIIIANTLLRTLYNPAQPTPGADAPRQWPWRWTLCAYCAIWLLFIVAFGSAGVLRHTTWLMDLREPWYTPREYAFSELRMAESLVQELLLDNGEELVVSRKAFAALRAYRRELVSEEFNVIFYGDTNSHVTAYVIIPRKANLRAKDLFLVSTPELRRDIIPMSELPQTLSTLDARYPSQHASAVDR